MALAILAKILVSEITKIKPKPIDASVVSEILRRKKSGEPGRGAGKGHKGASKNP